MNENTLPQWLGDRYQLLELLGVGGMAEVYRARMAGPEGFAKTVVIKRLLPQFARDPEIVAQFVGEARLAALLHHDNIADIYDFGESQSSYYIAMEYLVGRDLHTVLRQVAGSGLGLAPALFVAAAICAGMEYAHRRTDDQGRPLGIIHRDLSPHNVFISDDGVVKIIDFGVAKAELYDHRTQPGMVKGKMSYMSPEQLAGAAVDHRSDIFTIGILLYEMLTGQRMYSGDTATLLRKCLAADYRDVAELLPDLPPAVLAIVRRSLAKEVDERYQSCGEMRAALEESLFALEGRYGSEGLRQRLGELFPEALPSSEAVAALSPGDDDGGEQKRQGTMIIGIPEEERQAAGERPPPRAEGRGRLGLPLVAVAALAVLTIVALGLFLPGRKAEEAVAPSVEAPSSHQPALSSPVPPPTTPAGRDDRSEPPAAANDEEATIANLLAEAEQALADGERVVGGEAKALAAYRRVLELHPFHGQAEAGLAMLAERYRKAAEQALRAGRLLQAGVHLRRGLAAFPEDGQLLELQQRFERQRRQAVEVLSGRAEAALADNRLTTPAEDCAFKYYKEIEQLEGRSALVSRGLARIVDRYAALAEEAYRNLQRDKCREFVRQGLAIDPRHPQLLQLQRDLQRSPPGMFFKSLEKSFRPLFKP